MYMFMARNGKTLQIQIVDLKRLPGLQKTIVVMHSVTRPIKRLQKSFAKTKTFALA